MEEKIKELIETFEKEIKDNEVQILVYENETYNFKDYERFLYDRAMYRVYKGNLYAYENVVDRLKAILENEVENEHS